MEKGKMSQREQPEQYEGEQAARRFEAALCGARIVTHTPMKEIAPTRTKKKRDSKSAVSLQRKNLLA
jgi:hypothetical protein